MFTNPDRQKREKAFLSDQEREEQADKNRRENSEKIFLLSLNNLR